MVKDGPCPKLFLSDQRDYLHGGDLLDVLVTTFRIEAPVALRIFKLSDAALEIARSTGQSADRRAAFLAVGEEGRAQGYWLSTRRGEVITGRSALSDDHILADCEVTQMRASLANPDPSRKGRVAVVLAVALVKKLYPGAKWRLGDISCRCYFDTVAWFSVKLHHDSSRFVTLSVEADGAQWGRLVLVRSQEGTSDDVEQP